MKVIQVENLSKQYRLGVVSSKTLAADVNRFLAKVRDKEDPMMTVGVENRIDTVDGDYIWALKDINFEVNEGEVLGIGGKNGAGKSTILKILSKVTAPTTGSVKIKGRIASLLEVGTGFHPELTGKENIFLNGAILGMTKAEIRRKFDEIVEFSGVGKYIDTPVKRYSSGMYVRLAFAVAAHLEPEILIVDEVLAVGDAEFQKKVLGKMKDVSQQGRTVLFVSHNMVAVKSLCTKGILLENGMVKEQDLIGPIIDSYLNQFAGKGIINNEWTKSNAPGTDIIKVKSAYVEFKGSNITVNSPFKIVTEFWCEEEGFPVNVSMVLWDKNQNCVFNISTDIIELEKGLHKATFNIPEQLMNDGYYYVQNYFVTNSTPHFIHNEANAFEIIDERDNMEWYGKWIGAVRPNFVKTELL